MTKFFRLDAQLEWYNTTKHNPYIGSSLILYLFSLDRCEIICNIQTRQHQQQQQQNTPKDTYRSHLMQRSQLADEH